MSFWWDHRKIVGRARGNCWPAELPRGVQPWLRLSSSFLLLLLQYLVCVFSSLMKCLSFYRLLLSVRPATKKWIQILVHPHGVPGHACMFQSTLYLPTLQPSPPPDHHPRVTKCQMQILCIYKTSYNIYNIYIYYIIYIHIMKYHIINITYIFIYKFYININLYMKLIYI